MSDAHQRYEQMAVGHVLGGLDAVDAAEFRSHLVDCRHCRLRVAELRGIASDLAAAEREERVAARVKTEVARRADEDDPDGESDEGGQELSRRALAVVAAVAALAAVGLLAWNFHLRDVNRTLLVTTEAREQVLSMLASGSAVAAELAEGVQGVVVVEDGEVALDLAGVPEVGPDRWLAVWLVNGAAPHRYESFPASAVQEGRFATYLPHRGADRVVVSLEDRPTADRGLPEEPTGLVLVDAEIPDGLGQSRSSGSSS